MLTPDAQEWVRALQLSPHPEGGYFRETWRAGESLLASALPERFGGERSLGTAILYLLPAGEHSSWHRLRADEVWHLYDGGPLHLHLLLPGQGHERVLLGRDLAGGERPQAVVPHGAWFAAEVPSGARTALVGCTTAPGFDFADFELGSRETLLAEFPGQREWIERLAATKG